MAHYSQEATAATIQDAGQDQSLRPARLSVVPG